MKDHDHKIINFRKGKTRASRGAGKNPKCFKRQIYQYIDKKKSLPIHSYVYMSNYV